MRNAVSSGRASALFCELSLSKIRISSRSGNECTAVIFGDVEEYP